MYIEVYELTKKVTNYQMKNEKKKTLRIKSYLEIFY